MPAAGGSTPGSEAELVASVSVLAEGAPPSVSTTPFCSIPSTASTGDSHKMQAFAARQPQQQAEETCLDDVFAWSVDLQQSGNLAHMDSMELAQALSECTVQALLCDAYPGVAAAAGNSAPGSHGAIDELSEAMEDEEVLGAEDDSLPEPLDVAAVHVPDEREDGAKTAAPGTAADAGAPAGTADAMEGPTRGEAEDCCPAGRSQEANSEAPLEGDCDDWATRVLSRLATEGSAPLDPRRVRPRPVRRTMSTASIARELGMSGLLRSASTGSTAPACPPLPAVQKFPPSLAPSTGRSQESQLRGLASGPSTVPACGLRRSPASSVTSRTASAALRCRRRVPGLNMATVQMGDDDDEDDETGGCCLGAGYLPGQPLRPAGGAAEPPVGVPQVNMAAVRAAEAPGPDSLATAGTATPAAPRGRSRAALAAEPPPPKGGQPLAMGSDSSVATQSRQLRRGCSGMEARGSKSSTASAPNLHAQPQQPQVAQQPTAVMPPPLGPPPAVPQSLRGLATPPLGASPPARQLLRTPAGSAPRAAGTLPSTRDGTRPHAMSGAGVRLPPVKECRQRRAGAGSRHTGGGRASKVVTVHSHYHLHYHVFSKQGSEEPSLACSVVEEGVACG